MFFNLLVSFKINYISYLQLEGHLLMTSMLKHEANQFGKYLDFIN